MGDKVRRQHYVWRNYLRAWANEKDIIHCLRENRIFSSNLMGVAQRRDFYRLQELDEDDIFWIERLLIKPSPEFLQPLHRNLLSMFNAPFKMIEELKKRGIGGDEFEKQSDIIINNAHEKIHTIIEGQAIPWIEKLQNKDISFYQNDENRRSFLYFISTQYFRTNKIRTSMINQLSDSTELLKRAPKEFQSKKYNIEKLWGIMIHILATNLSYNLSHLKYKIVLIENDSSLPFITGDQPLINTFAVGMQPGFTPKKLDFYYPISPSVAVWLTKNHKVPNSHILVQDEKEIDSYNRGIVSESIEQVYASSKNVLEIFQNIKAA